MSRDGQTDRHTDEGEVVPICQPVYAAKTNTAFFSQSVTSMTKLRHVTVCTDK